MSWHRYREAFLFCVCAAILAATGFGNAMVQAGPIYSGKLKLPPLGLGEGEIVVGGGSTNQQNWSNGILEWTVSQDSSGLWHYQYTFDIAPDTKPAVSHIIFEVSANLLVNEILNATMTDGAGNIASVSPTLGDFGPSGPSTPGIPGTLHGIKFERPESLTAGTKIIVSFDTFRSPVWGDFYAKGGAQAFAYNKGFTNPDFDPSDPPSNGSLFRPSFGARYRFDCHS